MGAQLWTASLQARFAAQPCEPEGSRSNTCVAQ